jgi:hypothetical protein
LGLFIASELNATAILLDLGRNAIYVAADGRITAVDSAGTESHKMGCKIRTIGNLTIAHSGRVTTDAANFDAWRILNSLRADSVSEFAVQAEIRLREEAEKFYRIEKAAPVGDVTIDIAIAAFERGEPKAERVTLIRASGQSARVEKDTAYSDFLSSLPVGSKEGSMFPLAVRWLPEVDVCLNLSTTVDMLRCGLRGPISRQTRSTLTSRLRSESSPKTAVRG